jgi:hypothetical protein
VVGRETEISDLGVRLSEGQSATLVGPRRAGKTTVCDAVCAALASSHLVVRIEVPESRDSSLLGSRIVAECERRSLADEARKGLRAIAPALTKLLGEEGVTADLGELLAEPEAAGSRDVLQLPIALARAKRRRLVLFLDELQRAVDYGDGADVLADLVELYGPRTPDAVVLIDGSSERSIEKMLGDPHHVAKIAPRVPLAPRIAKGRWRPALEERFARLEIAVEPQALDALIEWGDGRPYATIAAAAEAATIARRMNSTELGDAEISVAIDLAARRVDDDDA